MLYLSLVGTYRTSDVCQGRNVISCLIPVNLGYTHNCISYFYEKEKGREKVAKLLVECDIGKILITDLRSITNCLFEMLFHRENQ